MPEHVEAGHGVVDLFDKASVEAFDSRDGCAAFTFAAEEDQPSAAKQLAGEAARDTADHVEALFLGHRSDDSAYDGARRPAALLPPIARPFYLRRRNS